MLQTVTTFLSFLAFALFLGGCYVGARWLVRHRPGSPVGRFLKDLPMFSKVAAQGQEEAEGVQRQVRASAASKAARDLHERRDDFRLAQAPNDSMIVTFPNDGQVLTMGVAGTLRMAELVQRDPSVKTHPWTSTSQQFVFQILKGKRRAWVFEGPGVLALITKIETLTEEQVAVFVQQGKLYGRSKPKAEDIEIKWDNETQFVYDIGRGGMYESVGETPKWDVAPDDPGRGAWDDLYIMRFILAGPNGGSGVHHEMGERIVCILTPAVGSGGYILTGELINDRALVIQEEG